MNEQDAIKQLKQGDINGLEVLVRMYQLEAVRAAYLVTRDRSMAEDVVQDAFLQSYECIKQFDAQRLFKPWFMKIVLNHAVKVARKNSRNLSLSYKADQDQTDLTDTLPAQAMYEPEVVLAQAETRKAIFDAMDKLSPSQRAVIVQRYYLNMSEMEMACALNAAPGTIKWHLHNARKRLRLLLAAFKP